MSRGTKRLLTGTLAAGLVLSMGSAALAAPPVGALKQFKVPTANSQPRYITNGSDGNRWFTEESTFPTSRIGRVTPSGAITEFEANCQGCGLNDIAQGPGGILYITNNGSSLLRFNVSTLTFESPVVIAETGSFNNLAVGGGNVWITDFNADVVWRYGISTGQIDTFSATDPSDVAVDAAGNAWFTENTINGDGTTNIFRIGATATPGAPDAVTTFQIPEPAHATGAITVATDGQVWFASTNPAGVGRLNPGNGAVTPFPIPNLVRPPRDIAAGPGGAIWFTQDSKDNIARIDNSGTVTEGKAVRGSSPLGVVVDPDTGNPWYTMQDANKIATLQLR